MSEAIQRMFAVASDIVEERQRQVKKLGEQHHPDGDLGTEVDRQLLEMARMNANTAHEKGKLTWRFILEEEIYEAFVERYDPVKLRAELVQVAAVCAAWIEDIDSRKP